MTTTYDDLMVSMGLTPSGPAVTIQFEPPAHPVLRGTDALTEFAEKLRSRPREWALLGATRKSAGARQIAYRIRLARHSRRDLFAPAGSFEAESRSLLGEHRVYVRYIGGAR